MSEKIKELDEENFYSEIDATVPVIVDFWAPWCGPCKAIAPILEELAEELGDTVKIFKVNVDNNGKIVGKYEVKAIPTLLIFKNKEVVDKVVGLASKKNLKEKITAIP
jgi:thioredoxin 1